MNLFFSILFWLWVLMVVRFFIFEVIHTIKMKKKRKKDLVYLLQRNESHPMSAYFKAEGFMRSDKDDEEVGK